MGLAASAGRKYVVVGDWALFRIARIPRIGLAGLEMARPEGGERRKMSIVLTPRLYLAKLSPPLEVRMAELWAIFCTNGNILKNTGQVVIRNQAFILPMSKQSTG
jgi:hypothetical protein